MFSISIQSARRPFAILTDQTECSPQGNISFYESLDQIVDVVHHNQHHADDFGLGKKTIVCSQSEETIEHTNSDWSSKTRASIYRGFEIKCYHQRWRWSKRQFDLEQVSTDIRSCLSRWSIRRRCAFWNFLNFPEEENRYSAMPIGSLQRFYDMDCFEVKANIALRDQVTRLNNNRAFGGFCIRMLAEQILKELVIQCLLYAINPIHSSTCCTIRSRYYLAMTI